MKVTLNPNYNLININSGIKMISKKQIQTLNYTPALYANNINLLSFKGVYQPEIKHSAFNSVFNPDFKRLSIIQESKEDAEHYTLRTISEFFKQDRRFLNNLYFSDKSARFASVATVQEMFKNENSDISRFLDGKNLRYIEKGYKAFYDSSLKSLDDVAKGTKEYSSKFLEKYIGNNNLAKTWLNQLKIPATSNVNTTADLNAGIQKHYRTTGNVDDLYKSAIELYFQNLIHHSLDYTELDDDNSNNFETLKNIKSELSLALDSNGSEQKKQFTKLVSNDDFMSFKINGIDLADILLEPLSKNGINIDDISSASKLEFLNEINEDKFLRLESLEYAASVVTKARLQKKSINEKNELAEQFVQKNTIENLNSNILKQIYMQNSAKDANQILQNLQLFEKEATRAFMLLVLQEPFKNNKPLNMQDKESINIVLSLVFERLNTTEDEDEAQQIYSLITKLADKLYDDGLQLSGEKVDLDDMSIFDDIDEIFAETFDPQEAKYRHSNEVWSDLYNVAVLQWKEKHFTNLLNQQQQNYVAVKAFLDSPLAKEVKNTGIIDTVFNSNNITPEAKAFLAKQAQLPFGYDLCKFLSEYAPSNYSRQKIIENLIENEKNEKEIYKQIKTDFLNAVSKKDTNSSTLQTRIKNDELLNVIFLEMTNENGYNRSISEKINILNKYPEEELLIVLNNIEPDYMKEKSQDAFEYETLKYDMSAQFERISKDIEIDIDGRKYSILDIVENRNLELQKLIKSSDKANQAKFNKVCAFLSNNTKQANELYALLGILIDKIQYANPGYTPQCREARTFLQKIRNGIMNPGTLIFGGKAIELLVAGAGATSLVLPLFIIATNIYNSFKR